MKEFKNWHDIQDWAKENGFKNIVKRMQINNDYWNSSQKIYCPYPVVLIFHTSSFSFKHT